MLTLTDQTDSMDPGMRLSLKLPLHGFCSPGHSTEPRD